MPREAGREPWLVRALPPARALQAYPVIREAVPEASAAAWRCYSRAFLRRTARNAWPAGILAAESADGYILGLLTYEIRPLLSGGRCLRVDQVAVPDLLARTAILEDLVDALVALARRSGCAAMDLGSAALSEAMAPRLSGAVPARLDRRWIIGLQPG